jgi:hypothetical protein
MAAFMEDFLGEAWLKEIALLIVIVRCREGIREGIKGVGRSLVAFRPVFRSPADLRAFYFFYCWSA